MQTPLAILTIPLNPRLHILIVLLCSIQHRADLRTLLSLVQQPMLVLCFHHLLLNAVHDAQGNKQVVTLRAQIAPCALETPRAVRSGVVEGVWGGGGGVVEKVCECLVAALGKHFP